MKPHAILFSTWPNLEQWELFLLKKLQDKERYTNTGRYLIGNVRLYSVVFGLFLRWRYLTIERSVDRSPHRSLRSFLHSTQSWIHNMHIHDPSYKGNTVMNMHNCIFTILPTEHTVMMNTQYSIFTKMQPSTMEMIRCNKDKLFATWL